MMPMKSTTRALSWMLFLCCSGFNVSCTDGVDERQGEQVPVWSLVEEQRIGSLDDPEQALTSPVWMAVGPNGHLYIGQSQAGQIWQYDPDGHLVRRIGRKGEGPGEFNLLLTLGTLGDTLYASDYALGRVSLFSLDGTHLNTIALVLEPRHESEYPTPPYLLLPGGSALVSPASRFSGAGTSHPRSLVRIDRSGEPLNVLHTYSAPTHLNIRIGPRSATMQRPLSDYPFTAAMTDGSRMVVVDRSAASGAGDAEFRLTEVTLGGDTMRISAHPYRPIRVPVAVGDSIMADLVRRMAPRLGGQGAVERAVHAAFRLPEFYPPVASAIYSDDSHLWIAREDRPEHTTRRWEVYSEGQRIAELTLPRKLQVHLVRGERLWSVEQDEYDIPYIVRYRIDRSPH